VLGCPGDLRDLSDALKGETSVSKKQIFVLVLVGIVLTGALMIALAATGNTTALTNVFGGLVFVGAIGLPFVLDLWDDRGRRRR